jgi:HSP20 family protein
MGTLTLRRGFMLSFPEVNELSEDVRRLFEELDRRQGQVGRCPSGIHTPPIDVVETEETVEVLIDLPGVQPADVRVLFKQASLLVAGEKAGADPCGPEGAAFHLVERSFGRFARVIRLGLAIDASAARAVLLNGELRVSIPRISERRGREIAVRIETPTG